MIHLGDNEKGYLKCGFGNYAGYAEPWCGSVLCYKQYVSLLLPSVHQFICHSDSIMPQKSIDVLLIVGWMVNNVYSLHNLRHLHLPIAIVWVAAGISLTNGN